MSRGVAAVRAFVEAFNEEDLDRLAESVDPEIEIQTSRGLVRGRDEARRWATRNPSGELHQRLVLDDARERGDHVVARMRRQWFWRESGEVADEEEIAAVATLHGDRLCRWQPFSDVDEAHRAAGIESGPGTGADRPPDE